MNDVPITYWGVAAAYGILIFPLAILLWTRVPLIGRMLIGGVRMTVQLLLVGLYLQVVFNLDNPWLNAGWVLVMLFVADVSIVRGAGMRFRTLALPLFIALLIGISIPLLYFLGVILMLPDLLEARFVIPIGGMILGNCLRANIIGIRRFFHSIRQGDKAYRQQLADGATLHEATLPYLRHTLEEALAPTLATMSTIGLVSLPGMMTGVILGGSDPRTAVMYQIAIMIAIFTGTNMTIFLGILLCKKVGFQVNGLLNPKIFKD